jgi:hypothetical protein
MPNIQENDVVGLVRDISPDLPQKTLGKVLRCYEDGYDVQFPIAKEVYEAKVGLEDVELMAGDPQA